ncbi:MAG: hypothetical protein JWN25_150 [Verrucomicrobiales bacterium]|nr:hypothetical protein [Verrucomicrobiales bacterium]
MKPKGHRLLHNPLLPGFTLIEMLAVLAIVGIIVSMTVPAVVGLSKANTLTVAARQLSDDLNLARQMAINNRSVVYVLFVSTIKTPTIKSLQKGQGSQYAFFSDRKVGDQPGVYHPVFLGKWKSLPENMFIIPYKFANVQGNPDYTPFPKRTFKFTREFFPGESSDLDVEMPYVAFSPAGKLLNGRQQDELITVFIGSMVTDFNPNGTIARRIIFETPVGDYTNQPTRIRVDWVTGKSRIERLEIK